MTIWGENGAKEINTIQKLTMFIFIFVEWKHCWPCLNEFNIGKRIKEKNRAHLADGETKNLLKISWLANKQEIKGPTAAKVGHDNGVDWHRGEEPSPWSLEFLKRKQSWHPCFQTSAVEFGLTFGFWCCTSVALIKLTPSPIVVSMYVLSSSLIVGCTAGLS